MYLAEYAHTNVSHCSNHHKVHCKCASDYQTMKGMHKKEFYSEEEFPPAHVHVIHKTFNLMLTVCDLEYQDSSLSWLFLSNINKRSAHNIEGVSGVSTFPQGARG